MARGPLNTVPEVKPKPSKLAGTGRLVDTTPFRSTETPWNISDAGPKNKATDLYVSTCKVCVAGIYRTQPHHWSNGDVLGLVHDWCRP